MESSLPLSPPRPTDLTDLESDMQPMTAAAAEQEPWYKYGVAILLLEMLIAIAVSGYSLYMTFHGIRGFAGGKL